MAFDLHTNFAYGVVAVAPSPAASGLTLQVGAGQGALFPAAPFNCTVWPAATLPFASNTEIVRVTVKVGDTFTIVRAQESTAARTILVGDQIQAGITVKTVTDIEATATAAISAFGVSASNTSGALSALTFANGNGVSFGLSNGTLTATVATNYQSAGAYLTTAALSQDSSRYAGTNGAITGGSITVNTSGVSVNLPAYLTTAALSNHSHGNPQLNLTNLSGTTASNSAGLTLSLSAAAPGAGGGVAVAGSNTTYTSGTALFTGVGGGVTVSSNTGQRIDISVAAPVAQTVQTQNLHNLSLSGNTAGVLAQISSGTAIFAGGNNITLSQNGQSITISGANAGGAQTGISGLIVSDATYSSGTVSFSNAGNITISSSVNGATQYIRLSGNPAQTNQTIGLFASSNTYLTSSGTADARSLSFRGDKSITVGISGSEVLFSVGAYLTTADLSANSSKYAQNWKLTSNTAGTTSSAFGTDLWLAGGQGITLSGNSNSITFSVGSYITTADLSQNSSLYRFTSQNSQLQFTSANSNFVQATAVFNGTNATGTIASGAISVSVGAQSNQTVGGYAVGNTTGQSSSSTFDARTLSFNGAGNVSVGYSNSSIIISGGTAAPSPVNFSAGTTSGNLGSVVFSNSNGVSFGLNGSTITASAAGGAAGAFGVSTDGGNNTGSYQLGTVWFSVNDPVNGALAISVVSSNNGSHTVLFDVPVAQHEIGMSNLGNTSGTTGVIGGPGFSYYFAGGDGVTLSQSIDTLLSAGTVTAKVGTYDTVGTATTYYPVASANSVGTVTRWALEDHRHAGIGAIGISTSGTAGTTGSVQGTYWFQGGNNITVSQITSNNGSHTLAISAGNYITTARASTDAIGLNTAQTNVTWTVNSSGLSLNAGGYAGTVSGGTNATLTVNTAGISVSVAGHGTASMWPHPFPISTSISTYYSGSTSQGAGGGSTQTGYTFSLYAVPMVLPLALAFSELRIGVSNTRSTAGTGSVTHLYSVGFYSNNASTLSLVEDFYGGLGFSQNSVTAQTFKLFTLTTGSNSVAASGGYGGLRSDGTVYSSAGNISANSQMDGLPGIKFVRVDDGAVTTLTAGQYYCVFGFASASASVNVYANVGILQSAALSTNNIPDLGRENSTQTSNYLPAWGAISTSFTSVSNAATFFPLPTAIAISNMTMSNSSGQRFHFPYMRNHS